MKHATKTRNSYKLFVMPKKSSTKPKFHKFGVNFVCQTIHDFFDDDDLCKRIVDEPDYFAFLSGKFNDKYGGYGVCFDATDYRRLINRAVKKDDRLPVHIRVQLSKKIDKLGRKRWGFQLFRATNDEEDRTIKNEFSNGANHVSAPVVLTHVVKDEPSHTLDMEQVATSPHNEATTQPTTNGTLQPDNTLPRAHTMPLSVLSATQSPTHSATVKTEPHQHHGEYFAQGQGAHTTPTLANTMDGLDASATLFVPCASSNPQFSHPDTGAATLHHHDHHDDLNTGNRYPSNTMQHPNLSLPHPAATLHHRATVTTHRQCDSIEESYDRVYSLDDLDALLAVDRHNLDTELQDLLLMDELEQAENGDTLPLPDMMAPTLQKRSFSRSVSEGHMGGGHMVVEKLRRMSD